MSPRTRARLRRLAPVLMLLALAGLAWARLGGGQSYSGGGGSYSGGGGGGGGDDALVGFLIELLLRILIELVFEYPEVGIPLLIGCAVVFFLFQVFGSSDPLARRARAMEVAPPPRSAPLDQLRRLDDDFSRVVFLDLMNALFHRVHEARGHHQWAPLRPYLAERLWAEASAGKGLGGGLPQVDAVEEVVIGSITPTMVEPHQDPQRVYLRIRANYVERSGDVRRPLYVEQTWTLVRPRGTPSPKPETARTLGCPSCGATVELTPEGVCTFCDAPVARGRHGWRVHNIASQVRRDRPELQAVLGVEPGTDSPTRFAPDLDRQRRELTARHPGFSMPEFQNRVAWMFAELQAGWSAQDEARLRPLETDMLFQTHRFWLERYRKKGWRNVLEDVVIRRMQVARVEVDAYYESITVRIFASMRDYIEDEDRAVIGGTRGQARHFSEYWTLVRTVAGANRPEKPAGQCPSCGAPLDDVSAAGVCGYCDSKIVTGEYGWVLALIEQDEEYAG